MEETGNFSLGCPGLYTQIFRIRAGSWSIAYTVYSIFQGPSRFLVWSVYRKLEEPGPRAKSVYSEILGLGKLLVAGVYKILEKPGPRAKSVYSNFQGLGRLLIPSVYRRLEKTGSGQNLYTQIFRIRGGSWSIAYTESSKISGPGQAPS